MGTDGLGGHADRGRATLGYGCARNPNLELADRVRGGGRVDSNTKQHFRQYPLPALSSRPPPQVLTVTIFQFALQTFLPTYVHVYPLL